MQLTKLDRWLREKFVLETHIYTMRPPSRPPAAVRYEELPDKPGRRFKHLFVLRSNKDVDNFIARLKADSQMFTTRVVNRKDWYVPYLAPENNKSVTWWVVGKIVLVWSLIGIGWLGFHFWDNPETRANIMDSLRIFKG